MHKCNPEASLEHCMRCLQLGQSTQQSSYLRRGDGMAENYSVDSYEISDSGVRMN
jgi:hypothetical protein